MMHFIGNDVRQFDLIIFSLICCEDVINKRFRASSRPKARFEHFFLVCCEDIINERFHSSSEGVL